MSGAFLKSGSGVLTIWHNGDSLTVAPDHPNYIKIKEQVQTGDFSNLENLLNVAKALTEYSQGKVSVRHGQVFYGEHEVRGTLIDRIITGMAEGKDFKRYVSFLDKLLENPSSRSLEQLYDFLKYTCLRIGDDGYFYAYKGVNENWTDKYTGRVDNSIGKVISMPRNFISDDAEKGCDFGFHCGTIKYAREYSGERLLIVRVDPKNVVSVPKDCTYQKCRVCEYTVVAECDYDGNPKGDWKFSANGADDVIEGMKIGAGFTNSPDDEGDVTSVVSEPAERVYSDEPSVPYVPDDCEDRDDEDDDDYENDMLADYEDDEDDNYCDDCGSYLNSDGSCDTCDEDEECEEDDEDSDLTDEEIEESIRPCVEPVSNGPGCQLDENGDCACPEGTATPAEEKESEDFESLTGPAPTYEYENIKAVDTPTKKSWWRNLGW